MRRAHVPKRNLSQLLPRAPLFKDCVPAFVKRIIMEELGVAVHAEGSAAEVRLDTTRVVFK